MVFGAIIGIIQGQNKYQFYSNKIEIDGLLGYTDQKFISADETTRKIVPFCIIPITSIRRLKNTCHRLYTLKINAHTIDEPGHSVGVLGALIECNRVFVYFAVPLYLNSTG